jgi:amidohydrolase
MSSDALNAKVKELAKASYEEVRAMRRHMHANPELSFVEFETSKFVTEKLDSFGISYKSGYVKTGIVAVIEGQNPSSKTIALRADMDALPIVEENDVPYCSTKKGVMHACGHDVHTASLLGVGKILQELRNEFEGTVKLIFQPGEERLPGGASLMIAEGVLENPTPQTIYGQHVFPELEAGQVGFRSGMYMASCDELHVTVNGKGGHGAMPHKNIDPVLIASHIVVALQQITSRSANPETPTVLSFGRFIAEGATNIIPNKVALEGTFRTFNEEWRAEAHVKMKHMAETIAESMGGTCDFRIDKGYPFLVNDEAATANAKSRAIEFLGAENVKELPLRMTAEDFSYYSQVAPACFYRLGTSDFSKGIDKPVHNAQFDIDERALETSIGLMSWIALRELNS